MENNTNMGKLIRADLDYINGYLRYGHYELELTDEDYEEYSQLSQDDKESWIKDEGDLILDDYEVNDYGDLINIIEQDV